MKSLAWNVVIIWRGYKRSIPIAKREFKILYAKWECFKATLDTFASLWAVTSAVPWRKNVFTLQVNASVDLCCIIRHSPNADTQEFLANFLALFSIQHPIWLMSKSMFGLWTIVIAHAQRAYCCHRSTFMSARLIVCNFAICKPSIEKENFTFFVRDSFERRKAFSPRDCLCCLFACDWRPSCWSTVVLAFRSAQSDLN